MRKNKRLRRSILMIVGLSVVLGALLALVPDAPYDPSSRAGGRPVLPVVIAHRAYTSGVVPNSLPAIKKILDSDVGGIEIDVQLSADGVLFVFHDQDLDRSSTGSGRFVKKTSAEIMSLRMRTPEGATDLTIPTLREVFDLVGGKKVLFLDAKDFKVIDGGLSRAMASLIKEYGLFDSVVIESFNPFALRRFRDLDPRIRVMVDIAEDPIPTRLQGKQKHRNVPWVMKQDWYQRVVRRMVRPDMLGFQSSMDPSRLSHLGYPLVAWTVNDPDEALRLLEAGVVSFQTDRPLFMQTLIAELKRK